jgi:Flp pilus assembly secretin CpaC
VGKTLKVAVSGVNFSSLEQIDIGIEMKVTPIEITPQGTRVRVETSRSFLTDDGAGQFRESLSTFRQRVAATAEIGFGETLILSGLSESVDDNTYSETPLLGDLPLLGSAFNERSKSSRRDAALMLVTPSVPGRLPGRPQFSSEAISRLTRLWTEVVDPGSNGVDISSRLAKMRMFTRALPTDTPLLWPSAARQNTEALRDLVAPGMD